MRCIRPPRPRVFQPDSILIINSTTVVFSISFIQKRKCEMTFCAVFMTEYDEFSTSFIYPKWKPLVSSEKSYARGFVVYIFQASFRVLLNFICLVKRKQKMTQISRIFFKPSQLFCVVTAATALGGEQLSNQKP